MIDQARALLYAAYMSQRAELKDMIRNFNNKDEKYSKLNEVLKESPFNISAKPLLDFFSYKLNKINKEEQKENKLDELFNKILNDEFKSFDEKELKKKEFFKQRHIDYQTQVDQQYDDLIRELGRELENIQKITDFFS